MISLDNFNKNYVAKPDLALTSARVSTAVELSLPKGTLLHYVTDTIADLGLRGSNQLIQNWPGDIRLSFILDGMGSLGNPTKKAFTTAAAIQNFKRTQKRFIYQTDWQRVINNEMSLGVLDYSLLKVTYNHVSALWRQYHEWFNIAQSIIEKANLVGKTKTQLIPVTMPSGQWPSEAQFKHCEDKWGSSELEYMTDASHFWLRAIWRMGLGYTDELNFKSPENVYFAFIESGLVTIVNAKDLIARGIKDESKLRRELHDMWEKVIAARTKTDTEALADVKTDKRSENTPVTQEKAKTQLVEGVPDTATKRIIELGMAGKLTAAEQRRLIAVAQRERDHKSPFGDGTQTIAEAGTITVEKKKVNDDFGTKTRKGLSPAHARKSATTGFVKDYMANGLYEADMVNVLTAFGGTGTFLADIKKTEVIDAVNDMDIIEATYISVEGKKSPLKFEIPRIEKDGNFLADNTKYCLDAQWVDVPLRKTAPDIARISAYPGKVAVMRSPLAKNRYDRWLQKAIGAIALDAKDDRITNQQFGASKIPDVALPLEYTAVMTVMTKFKTRNGVVFFFDYENRATELGDAALKGETNKLVACGKRGNNPVYMSSNGTVFELSNGSMIDLGHFRDIVGGLGKPPRDIVETQVFKKRIPLALALTLHLGLSGLIKKMGAKYRSEPSNQRASAGSHEIAITFKDVRIYVDATDPVISMMFAGLADMDSLSSFSMSDIDRKDVVGSLLRTSGLDASGIVELEIINEAFLDPMTIDTLKDMKLPTNMIDLYLEAAKLVRNDQMQEETDRRLQRRRKMERVPGFVYVAIYNAIRRQRNKPNPSIHGLEVGPRDVWNAMTQDQTSQLVKDLNPIHTLKEQEAVSLSGAGGRSAVSLVKKSRAFSQTDVGVISESTPDSGKVGVRTYMSGNSKVKNLRGLYEEFDFKRDGSTSVLSTTALVMPGMTHDDAKRMNLASVQQSAVVPIVGAILMPLRTGYGPEMAARLPDLFCVNMYKKGKVIAKTNNILRVEYEDGTTQGWKLGRFHGTAEGKTIAHTRVTDMEVGDKFEPGYVIAWSDEFFERDPFVWPSVDMKMGALSHTALLENNDTLEDGSRISARLQKLMGTVMTKTKAVVLDVNQVVSGLVSVGDRVEYDSVVCVIEEAVSAELQKTDAALAALSKLSGSNPKAGFAGTVASMEVFYMATLEEMHPSIRKIVEADDKRRAKYIEETGERGSKTGLVRRATFIHGERVEDGKVVIVINIDEVHDQGVGDKGSFCNQLKTIHGGVLIGENYGAVDKIPVDAFFGYRSVNDRIVNSPIMQGTVNTTMIAASKEYARLFREG